jgi:hypothetical protein
MENEDFGEDMEGSIEMSEYKTRPGFPYRPGIKC